MGTEVGETSRQGGQSPAGEAEAGGWSQRGAEESASLILRDEPQGWMGSVGRTGRQT